MLSPAGAPAEEQLKARPGCAHGEGMETGRLSFMEIMLRGPRLAGGVWVPVVPGRAARSTVDGASPAFLPAAAWSPSRRASPSAWTAYEPLGFRLWQVMLWPRARSPVNLEHSSSLLAAPEMVTVCAGS